VFESCDGHQTIMDDYSKKLVQYLAKSIDDVCPYEDANLQRLYHLGFMQGFIAKMIIQDNKNLHIFQKVIEELKDE
jgi:hypothetical protein